jgi:hypothetical protein
MKKGFSSGLCTIYQLQKISEIEIEYLSPFRPEFTDNLLCFLSLVYINSVLQVSRESDHDGKYGSGNTCDHEWDYFGLQSAHSCARRSDFLYLKRLIIYLYYQ